MICNEARTLLQRYADDQIGAAEREALTDHLTGCPSCRVEAKKVVENVKFLAEHLVPLRDLVNLDLAYLDEAPAAAPSLPETPPRPRGDRPRRGLPLALAGLVTIGLGLGGYFLFGTAEPPPPEEGSSRLTERATRSPGHRTPRPPPRTDPGTARPENDAPPRQPYRPVPAKILASQLLPELFRLKNQASLNRVRKALADDSSDAAEVIRQLEKTGDATKRALVALTLSAARDLDWVKNRLVSLLITDASWTVRSAAAAALSDAGTGPFVWVPGLPGIGGAQPGPIDDVGIRERLLTAARSERDPGVVSFLIRLLTPSLPTSPDVIVGFLEMAETRDDPEVLRALLQGLGQRVLSRDRDSVLRLIRSERIAVTIRAHLVSSLDDRAELESLLAETREDELKMAVLEVLAKNHARKSWRRAAEIFKESQTSSIRIAALHVIAAAAAEEEMAFRLLEVIALGEQDPEVNDRAQEMHQAVANVRASRKEDK